MSVIYPTYSSVGNPQNGFPMVYFAPQQPFQSQVPHVYDPTAQYLAMPSVVPEQQPMFYTRDAHGNYVHVLLTPQQYVPPPSSDPKDVNGEHHPMLLSAAYSEGSIDSAPAHEYPPSFYNPYNLNTSVASRKSLGSGGNLRTSPAYKTMMCNMYSTNGSCTYGAACQYAHGPEEMRPIIPHPKYKTMLCNKFSSPAGCQYGEKCHFRHPDDPQPQGTPKTSQSQRKPSNGGGKKKKNGRKAAQQNAATPKAKPESASVNAAKTAENKDGKDGNLIKFAMYQCFESYVGKNRNSKPDALKRTNSSNTIGTFTLQRYVSMKKALDYMREAKKKPQPDAAVMKQQEKKCSSFKDQHQEAADVAVMDDKVNLSS